MPRAWQTLTAELPHRMGISAVRPGSFDDYATLGPVVALPSYVLHDAPSTLLDRYHRAHVVGGFFGLLRDRLWDREAPTTGAMRAMVERLFHQWEHALVSAHGERGEVRAALRDAEARARAAHRLEMRTRSTGHVDLHAYTHLVCDKTAWFGVASRLLVRRLRGRAAARSFDRIRGLLMLSLQAPDDAADADSDRQSKGFDFPHALDVSAASLFRAGALLSQHTAEAADECAFPELARWAGSRSVELSRAPFPRSGPLDGVLALALSRGMVRAMGDPRPKS